MNYTQFKDYIKENILKALPSEYSEATVEIYQVVKNNDVILDGLIISKAGGKVTPTIFLNPLFADYEKGTDIDKIIESIAGVRLQNYSKVQREANAISEWEQVKEKIGFRLVNADSNRRFLEDKPFSRWEDLAVVYYIIIEVSEYGILSTAVNNLMLEKYNIGLDELHKTALANMPVLMPVKFMRMYDMLKDMLPQSTAELFSADKDETLEHIKNLENDKNIGMYCLTNESKLNGAAAILYPGIPEMICGQVGGEYYVLPSSIHEVLIVPKDDEGDYKVFEKMVHDVNMSQVKEQERLSEHVYEYDAERQMIVRSGERKIA